MNKTFHRNIPVLLSIIVLLITLIFILRSFTYGSSLQESIAGKLVRFHVVANSDSKQDQALKLKVRDAVLEYLKPVMSDIDTDSGFDTVVHILDEQCPAIEDVAENVIKEQGYDYKVNAQVCECYFPAKEYMDIMLPPGDYTALKITIGEGNGHNWWCVMYPTLCFLDSTNAALPVASKNELKTILTDKEYDSIIIETDANDTNTQNNTDNKHDNNIENDDADTDNEITFSFRTLEWLKGLFD